MLREMGAPNSKKLGTSLIYFLHKCFSPDVPLALFELLTIFFTARGFGSRPYRAIELVAYPPYGVDTLSEIVDALEFLRRADPRRFLRLERHVKRIILCNRKPLGFYKSFGQICGLRKQVSTPESNPLALLGYAAVLVHEATHGFLDKRRFPYTSADKKRIERLCTVEEARFLSKFPGASAKLPLIFGHNVRSGPKRECL